jgi:hypothetical protein
MSDPIGEISRVQRRISSAWRVTPVFRKMCSRWVFAIGLVMPSVAAVSFNVRPANQAGEHLGFSRRQTIGNSQCVCTLVCVRWRTDEDGGNGCGLQPRAEIAPGERQDVSQDGRHMPASNWSARRCCAPR